MSAIKALCLEIVDYAGLFPPASLPLETVVTNYENYLCGDNRWMLSRLILPVSKLEQFEQQAAFNNSKQIWKISGLIPSVDAADNGFENAIQAISEFNSKHASPQRAIIDTVEVKTPTVELLNETIKRLPETINGFLEIPHHDDPVDFIKAIKDSGAGNAFAKIRTGGVKAELIPDPFLVARFIRCCADHNVGLKATAGLHHPLRGEYRLTYDPQPDSGTMFGFANVFLAASFAFSSDMNIEQLQQILTEQDAKAISINDETVTWKDHILRAEEIKRIRSTKSISFGSCSFDEPTTELQQLGWLGK